METRRSIPCHRIFRRKAVKNVTILKHLIKEKTDIFHHKMYGKDACVIKKVLSTLPRHYVDTVWSSQVKRKEIIRRDYKEVWGAVYYFFTKLT